ncbi:MAG: type IV secretion system DNA-binding domain-containing protein [Thermoplasmata archaeon]|nr:type IV secretion system DNA-binding domain-containing protein [Thermoplasmata archaeon]
MPGREMTEVPLLPTDIFLPGTPSRPGGNGAPTMWASPSYPWGGSVDHLPVHRSVLFPRRVRVLPDFRPFGALPRMTGALEVRWDSWGNVTYGLAFERTDDARFFEAVLQESYPGVQLVPSVSAIALSRPLYGGWGGYALRARLARDHDHPLVVLPERDYGNHLLHVLRTLQKVDVTLQVLFEPYRRAGRFLVEARMAVCGPGSPEEGDLAGGAGRAFASWIAQFNADSSENSLQMEYVDPRWWNRRRRDLLWESMLLHDPRRDRVPRDRRPILSGVGLAAICSFPSLGYHPELARTHGPVLPSPPSPPPWRPFPPARALPTPPPSVSSAPSGVPLTFPPPPPPSSTPVRAPSTPPALGTLPPRPSPAPTAATAPPAPSFPPSLPIPPPPASSASSAPALPFPPPSPTRSVGGPLVTVSRTPIVLGPSSSCRLVLGPSPQGGAVFLLEGWYNLLTVGRTRSGKTSLLTGIAVQIPVLDPGSIVVVVDSQGGLIEGVRSMLSPELAAHTVEIDPAQCLFSEGNVTRVSVGLNPLSAPDGWGSDPHRLTEAAHLLADALVSSFRTVVGDESVRSKTQHLLYHAARALVQLRRTNLFDLFLVLTDRGAAERLAVSVSDPVLRHFLEVELPTLQREPQWGASLLPALNKVEKIVGNPLLRALLSQRRSPVPMTRLLEERVLLLNLAKGRMGAESSTFLGSVLLEMIGAALQRGEGTGGRRVYLVVDEFQDLAPRVLTQLLAQGAKWGVRMVLATQDLSQVAQELRASLLANADAFAFLRCSPEDAVAAWEVSQAERAGLAPGDFVLLENFQGVAVQGSHLLPFRTVPLAPAPARSSAVREAVVASTRRFSSEEDSLDSPLCRSSRLFPRLLPLLEPTPLGTAELAAKAGAGEDVVEASLREAVRAGLLSRVAPSGAYALADLGRRWLEARRALRPGGAEGEEHTLVLARFALWAEKRYGCSFRMVRQHGSAPRPDGEMVREGRWCSVQVETLRGKNRAQVVRNFREGEALGRVTVFVVPDASREVELMGYLEEAGLSDRRGRSLLVLFEGPEGEFHRSTPEGPEDPFLLGPSSPLPSSGSSSEGPVVPSGATPRNSTFPEGLDPHDRAQVVLWETVLALRERGLRRASHPEIQAALPEASRILLPPNLVGRHLKDWGFVQREAWVRQSNGERRALRVYILEPLPSRRQDGAPPSEGP